MAVAEVRGVEYGSEEENEGDEIDIRLLHR